MIKRLLRRWCIWAGSLYVIQYGCTFCDYRGTIDMTRMEHEFIGPENCIKCPRCGLKTLWRRK